MHVIDFCQEQWIYLHLKNVLSPKSVRSCDEITPSASLKKLQTL